MSKFYRILRDCLPYGIVSRVKLNKKKKNTNAFWSDYLEYVRNGNHVKFLSEPSCRTIVSVYGLGYCGASAVIDLLREYNSTAVCGLVMETDGSLAKSDNLSYEVELLRKSGGLFELEMFIENNNPALQDAALKRLIMQIQSSPLYKYVPESRELFYEFFYQISERFCKDLTFSRINEHLLPLNELTTHEILSFKDITKEQFQEICKLFLYSLFALYNRSNKDILVMDALLADLRFDVEQYLKYIPNVKTIVLYRDPRDIYTFARMNNVEWIPHIDAEIFVRWYQRRLKFFQMHENKKYLVIRFEDLINDYEKTVHSIEAYLGLRSEQHINIKRALDPAISCRNVGIWRQHTENVGDYDRIIESLPQLCYK